MSTTSLPRLTAGGHPIDTSEVAFGWLRESNDAIDDPEELRRRMEADGYLYLPGFFERDQVVEVRTAILSEIARDGKVLDPSEDPLLGVVRPNAETYFRADIANKSAAKPALESLIYGERIMGFYDRFLGTPATHYDYTWLRTVAPGMGTYPHCDVVYMGRGSANVYTAWIPFGDIPLEVGGLIVVEGSQHDAELRSTYCHMDVDTACQNLRSESELNAAGYPGFGAISYDMPALRKRLDRRLLTASEFKMGDLLTFSVFTVHGSLDNSSRYLRISSDSRYQPANEPLDERWIGENPPGHGGKSIRGMIC